MSARVIGVGQPAAGDDAVGLEVARRVRDLGVAALEVHAVSDPTLLVDLLACDHRVIVVDAVRASGGDRVVRLHPKDLRLLAKPPLSSHGLGVADAIDLARNLYGDKLSRDIQIVAVAIDHAAPGTWGLSAAVQAAVERAVAIVLEAAHE